MKSGWNGESQRHSMANRGIVSTELRIPAMGIEQGNQTFIVKLPDGVYEKNKVRLKAIFKHFGLVFNKGQYFAGKYIWESANESVEGVFERDESGKTTKAEFILKTGEPFNAVFKPIIKILGGDWVTPEETKKIENKGVSDILKEELRARNQRWSHSPLLKPMIKEYFILNDIPFDDEKIEETQKDIWKQADDIQKNLKY